MTFRQPQKNNNNNVLVYISMDKMTNFLIKCYHFKFFCRKYSLIVRSSCYVLGLKFHSQPQSNSGVGSLTPECHGVLGFKAFLTTESLLV